MNPAAPGTGPAYRSEAITGRGTKPGRSAVARRQAWEGRIFALPFILRFLAFWLYPMAYSVYLVFQDWDLLFPPSFAGLDNIVEFRTSP